MKKIVCFLLVMTSLTSCVYFSVPSKLEKEFNFCYTNRYTGLDTLLNIEGYYTVGIISNNSYHSGSIIETDTIYLSLLFYPDGMFVRNFDNYDTNISNYLSNVVKYPGEGIFQSFHNWCSWGCYSIHGDTVKVMFMNHPSSPSPTWYVYENWFLIVDKNTIQRINTRRVYPTVNTEFYNSLTKDQAIIPASFIAVDTIPNSNCWLKKEEWFWCKQEDYMNYIKEIKEN